MVLSTPSDLNEYRFESSYVERRFQNNMLSIYSTNPPLSPPPTSPLPPIPRQHVRDESSRSDHHREHLLRHPIRPPRPQASLPNIAPRTIVSPEHSVLRHSSDFSTNFFTYPAQPRHKRLRKLAPSTSTRHSPVRCPSPILTTTSNFRDDFSSVSSDRWETTENSHNTDRKLDVAIKPMPNRGPKAWQVYHDEDRKRLLKLKERRSRAQQAIACTTHFVPTKPSEVEDHDIEAVALLGRNTDSPENVIIPDRDQGQRANLDMHPTHPSRYQARDLHNKSKDKVHNPPHFAVHPRFHRRNVPTNDTLSGSLSEKLPQEGHSATMHNTYRCDKEALSDRHQDSKESRCLDRSHQILSPPPIYAPRQMKHTTRVSGTFANMHLALPDRKDEVAASDYMIVRAFGPREASFETVTMHDIRNQSPEELNVVKRRKFRWILVTMSLVIVATAGVLIGIISKLVHIS